MNDFTVVNLQDLTTATGLTGNDFLAIGQGGNALTKATIQQVGAFLGVSASVVLGNKEVEPTVPSFAFAESGLYPEWGNVEIIGNLGILIFDGTNFHKSEINFIANGVVEEGNTLAVSGGEVFEKLNPTKLQVDKLLSERIILINKNDRGNFEDGLTGWNVRSAITNATVSNNELSFTGAGSFSTSNNWIQRSYTGSYPLERVLYTTLYAKSDEQSSIYMGVGYFFDSFLLTNEYKRYSYQGSHPSSNFPTMGAEEGKTITVKNVMTFDLTDIFGEGNEPTKEEMDDLIGLINEEYFESAKEIDNILLDKYYKKIFASDNKVNEFDSRLNNFLDFTFNSIILNGGFENNKANWTSAGSPNTPNGSTIVSDVSFKGNKSLKIKNVEGVRRETQSVETIIGHKYYVRGSYLILDHVSGIVIVMNISVNTEILEDNEWRTVSNIIESTGSSIEFHLGSNGNFATWEVCFDELVVCDLTEMFGAGNEPTKGEMDLLIDNLFKDKTLSEPVITTQKDILNYIKETAKPLSQAVYGLPHLITIANDDGRSTDYDMFKMMQRHGMRGTSFVIGTRLGSNNYLTENQVKEMATAGWEIACHTWEHKNLTQEVFPEGVIYQIETNKAFLENLTGKTVETFAHPFGGTNAEVQNLIRSFYKCARVSTGGFNDYGDNSSMYKLKTDWTDYGSRTVATIKNRIDAFLAGEPKHQMWSGHALASVTGGDELTLEEMEEIVLYLKDYQMQGKLEVVTFSEAVDRLKANPYYNIL